MSATIIDGKAFAANLRARVGVQAAAFEAAAGRKAGLAVVLVGDDAASAVYVKSKGKATLAAGMASFEHRLPADTTQDDLVALVEALNRDDAVDGILVQLPLPKHLDEQAVVATIDPAKDVDGLTPVSSGRLATGHRRAGALHAAGRADADRGCGRRHRGHGCDRDRAVDPGRQADGAVAAGPQRDRHHRAFADPRPRQQGRAGRYRRRGGGPRAVRARRMAEARRVRDRRRHQPDRRRAGRRCRFRRRSLGRGCD